MIKITSKDSNHNEKCKELQTWIGRAFVSKVTKNLNAYEKKEWRTEKAAMKSLLLFQSFILFFSQAFNFFVTLKQIHDIKLMILSQE